MNAESCLREVIAHLDMVVRYGLQGIPDAIDRDHIIDALTEARSALREMKQPPHAALIETLSEAAQ